MDANVIDKRPAATTSGLDSVRAQAQKQRQVRLQRTGPNPDMVAVQCSMQKLKTLKRKSTDELPEADREDSFLNRLWAGFQQFLGNR